MVYIFIELRLFKELRDAPPGPSHSRGGSSPSLIPPTREELLTVLILLQKGEDIGLPGLELGARKSRLREFVGLGKLVGCTASIGHC